MSGEDYITRSFIQGESLARGPKLLSIKNHFIEIMTWKFIYTYREPCKTGLAHNRCWNWSPFTSKHTWMRFSIFWNTFPKVSTLTAWISWRIASLSCSIVRCVFCTLFPSIGPKERSRQALDRHPLVSNFLTNFWMQHRWCTSFTKFRSKRRLACFKGTCLPVFTKEKPALFDCTHRHKFGASSERLTL